MAYAAQILTNPVLPHITLPKLRWPRLSPGARAILMMGLMISPAFVSDYIGYGVSGCFTRPGRSPKCGSPDDRDACRTLELFHVACAIRQHPRRISGNGLISRPGTVGPVIPQAVATCFQAGPGIARRRRTEDLQCRLSHAVLSVADRRRWMDIAAGHGWGHTRRPGGLRRSVTADRPEPLAVARHGRQCWLLQQGGQQHDADRLCRHRNDGHADRGLPDPRRPRAVGL